MKIAYLCLVGLVGVLATSTGACGGDSGGATSKGGEGGAPTTSSHSSTVAVTPPSSSSSSSGSGAGVPGCSAPAVSPSQGYCYFPFSTGTGSPTSTTTTGATSTTTASSTTTTTSSTTGDAGGAGATGGAGGAGGGTGGATGGTGGAGGGAGGATSGAGGAGGGAGGAPASCPGITNDNPCGACWAAKCCTETAACLAAPNCGNCLTQPTESCTEDEDTRRATDGVLLCLIANCPSECDVPQEEQGECNPVTNAGCGPDEWCDLSNVGFHCFPADPAAAGQCETCDISGAGCQPGLHCFEDSLACARYCCDDADCGVGRCDIEDLTGFTVGICVAQ